MILESFSTDIVGFFTHPEARCIYPLRRHPVGRRLTRGPVVNPALRPVPIHPCFPEPTHQVGPGDFDYTRRCVYRRGGRRGETRDPPADINNI